MLLFMAQGPFALNDDKLSEVADRDRLAETNYAYLGRLRRYP